MSITDTTIAPRVVAIDPGSYARPLEAAQAAVEEANAAWNSIIGGKDNLRVLRKSLLKRLARAETQLPALSALATDKGRFDVAPESQAVGRLIRQPAIKRATSPASAQRL